MFAKAHKHIERGTDFQKARSQDLVHVTVVKMRFDQSKTLTDKNSSSLGVQE